MVYNLKNHLNRFHIAAIIAIVMSHISKIEESAWYLSITGSAKLNYCPAFLTAL